MEVNTLITSTKSNLSVIALSETCLNESNPNLFQIQGYSFYSLERPAHKRGGGIGLYISDSFNCHMIDDFPVLNENFECLMIKASQVVN